jgi:hypothetical protein
MTLSNHTSAILFILIMLSIFRGAALSQSGTTLRRVSTSLRHLDQQFSDFSSLTFSVC